MFRPAVWRAINVSLTAAFVILALAMSWAIFETLFVPSGEGILNSDVTAPLTSDEKARVILQALMILPLELAGLALVFFLAQLPFLPGEP